MVTTLVADGGHHCAWLAESGATYPLFHGGTAIRAGRFGPAGGDFAGLWRG